MTKSPSGGATPRSAMDCPEARISLGVYVLGAIDPAERALVDAHLSTCRECRDELAGLAGLPALLARVSVEEATALAADGSPPLTGVDAVPGPPRELLATVLDLTAARRRRRRWRGAGLA
ncbi:MAG: anti-sigma factor family protein, partial [Trebonia sp.]